MDAQNHPHQQTASPPPATVSDISSYQAPAPQQQYQQPQYQQPQQTYVQPAMQPVPTAMRSPRLALYSKGTFNTKIVLRSLDLTFSITLIGLSVSLVLLGLDSYYYYSTTSEFLAGFGLPIGGLGFIWETAEFITICARGGKLGVHPGAHVGMHLVIWLLAAVGVSLCGVLVTFEGRYDSSWRYYDADPAIRYATLSFMSLLLIIHFVLFVMACVETHQGNRQSTAAVYVIQPNGQMYPMAMPMPMPMMQQPMPTYGYPGQQPVRQSTYSMAPVGVPPNGVEPKTQPGEGYNGGVQQGDSITASDGTYYGHGNGYSQQR